MLFEQRQVFEGGVDVTTTDGVTKRFADGDVLLVEDTTGQPSFPSVKLLQLLFIDVAAHITATCCLVSDRVCN